jgi:biopolymer transport protein ExbB
MSGGLILLPIAMVSFGIWLYFLRSRSILTGSLQQSSGLENCLSSKTNDLSSNAILDRVQAIPGFIAGVISKVLRDIQCGARLAESYDRRYSEAMTRLKRDLVVLAALTAVAPLLGLLGTVLGMIETFEAVSTVTGETTVRISAGISKALITTQFGLVVAIPGVFGLSRLYSLLEQVKVRFATIRAHLFLKVES